MILTSLEYHEKNRRYARIIIGLLIINVVLFGVALWKLNLAAKSLEQQTNIMKEDAETLSRDTTQSISPPIQTQPERIMAIKAVVTAYTARLKETNGDPQHTATMEKPIPGWTCAVSRDLAHWLGGKVWIDGIGVRRVNDLMHGRYKKRLDVLVGKPGEALQMASGQRQVVFLGRDQG